MQSSPVSVQAILAKQVTAPVQKLGSIGALCQHNAWQMSSGQWLAIGAGLVFGSLYSNPLHSDALSLTRSQCYSASLNPKC